jgi:hypothetical protein
MIERRRLQGHAAYIRAYEIGDDSISTIRSSDRAIWSDLNGEPLSSETVSRSMWIQSAPAVDVIQIDSWKSAPKTSTTTTGNSSDGSATPMISTYHKQPEATILIS